MTTVDEIRRALEYTTVYDKRIVESLNIRVYPYQMFGLPELRFDGIVPGDEADKAFYKAFWPQDLTILLNMKVPVKTV